MLHGAEGWALKRDHEKIITQVDMANIRRMTRTSRMRRVNSRIIRRWMGIDAGAAEEAQRRRVRHFGHVSRMLDHRIPKQLLDERMKSKRGTSTAGRPRKDWLNAIEDDLRGLNQGTFTAASTARKSKKKYRTEIVYRNIKRRLRSESMAD